MMVIVIENAPPRLRGRLNLWLTEIRAGTYMGSYGKRHRERLWADVKTLIGTGNAVIAWSAPTENGFAFDTAGQDRRTMRVLDGFALATLTADDKPLAFGAGDRLRSSEPA